MCNRLFFFSYSRLLTIYWHNILRRNIIKSYFILKCPRGAACLSYCGHFFFMLSGCFLSFSERFLSFYPVNSIPTYLSPSSMSVSMLCKSTLPLYSTALSLSESLCHGWPASSLCRASPGSAQLARCELAGQRQEAVPALLVQKGAHQADRPSVSSSMLSPRLPQSQQTHMPTYISLQPMHTSISGPRPNRFGPTGT